MTLNYKSYIFVLIQFSAGLFLFITASISGLNIFSISIIIAGLAISLFAIATMRKTVVRIVPDVDRRASLVKDGPYKYIRHPMYSGVIVGSFGLLLTDMSVIRLLIFIILAADLVIKLNYEEKLLEKHFKNYEEYKKKTFRLIPFIY